MEISVQFLDRTSLKVPESTCLLFLNAGPFSVWNPTRHHTGSREQLQKRCGSCTYLRFSSGNGSSWPGPPWHHWWIPTLADLKHCGHWEQHHLVVRGANITTHLPYTEISVQCGMFFVLVLNVCLHWAWQKCVFVAFSSIEGFQM